MPAVELSAGSIEYEDSGTGPVLVLLHGVPMDSGQWRDVARRLPPEFRCVLPTLPLGAHRTPMRSDADLSLALLGALPGGLRIGLASMRVKPMQRTPMAFGWMAKHGIPDDLVDGWLGGPWADKAIRADALRYIRRTREGRRRLRAATRHLGQFTAPVSVVWAKEDRVMPMREGKTLADAFPNSRLELVEDSYVLVPLDQPERMAELLCEHMAWQRSAATTAEGT
jgi:pimeloyl-ACP methyl ester carboxylesterase